MNWIKQIIRTLPWQSWLWVLAIGVVATILITSGVNKVIDHFNDNRQVQENNKDRELREELSVKRSESETKINNEERELNAELAKLPDAMPSDRRLARACRELRNDGHVELPVACRSASN